MTAGDSPGRDVDRWLDDLRASYGGLPVHEETFAVEPRAYERLRADAERAALGGARVRLAREDQLLLVSNRGEHGWDVPGGALEPGESLAETARREVREETGIACLLGDAIAVNRFGFVPREEGAARPDWDAGDIPAVEGLWVYFAGEPVEGSLDPQDAELVDAGWFARPPGELDRYADPLVRGWFDERATGGE